MTIGSDEAIVAAADSVIASRDAGEVVRALYHRTLPATDDGLNALAVLLPLEQIAAVSLVDRLNLSPLPSVVILLAILGHINTKEGWVHFALCKYLSALAGSGVPEAKLPAIIHSLLSLESLKDDMPGARALPLGVLARELAILAPREAIRSGMLAVRYGHAGGLRSAAPAIEALGLKEFSGLPMMRQVLQLARKLHLGGDNLPMTTSVENAAGLRTTVFQPARSISFPPVHGDASHYIFANAGRKVDLPQIAVHTLEAGTFSIDAASPGLEQHYVFDRSGHCVMEFANGIDPFVAEPVLNCDEPVAILDDHFSGVMNICHFLLDRVTRIPIYERIFTRPGKFLLIEDHPYHREILSRMGLAGRVIIPSSRRVTIRAPEILFSSNIAADFRHPAHWCSDWAIDYLRWILGIEERAARPGRKLFISRADARGRAILNWDEVAPVLLRHDFEVVVLAGLSAAAQMALFRDASQVVGVHGAGLTNILFAPRDCSVLEILSPLVATGAYWLLASSLGQRYSALIGEDAEMPRPDYTSWSHDPVHNNRDIIVPIDRLETALASL